MAEILETGNVHFFYRPVVEETAPEGLVDVQEFAMALAPRGVEHYRILMVGQKTLPSMGPLEEDFYRKAWGWVGSVEESAEDVLEAFSGDTYRTATRGLRRQPAARPAGSGVYAVALLPRYSAFAYVLEHPDEPGEVQRALRIESERLYVLAIKNPEATAPPGVGLEEERRAEYPEELQGRFRSRRFVDAVPPEFLDYPGTEFVLIGAHEDVEEELGVEIEEEAPDTAELFETLREQEERRAMEPLLRGEWE